ncbi:MULTISPECIES: hypothetical protein [unclassified Caballeronia]|uniref:hypothetical protein n=1 Tax=unclassified Caballeronia TaxID=2646786 RepID=UPI0020296059|nr:MULTISPECIES: hypothetical protein [unclassified Caballeronia]
MIHFDRLFVREVFSHLTRHVGAVVGLQRPVAVHNRSCAIVVEEEVVLRRAPDCVDVTRRMLDVLKQEDRVSVVDVQLARIAR